VLVLGIRSVNWGKLRPSEWIASNMAKNCTCHSLNTSLEDRHYANLLRDMCLVSQMWNIVSRRPLYVCAPQLVSTASVLLALASISIPLNFVAWSENVQIFAWGFRMYRVWLLGPGRLTEKGVGWGVEWCYTFIWSDYPYCIYREYGTNECFSVYRIGWCLYCMLAVV
jgi:hypothetical protein